MTRSTSLAGVVRGADPLGFVGAALFDWGVIAAALATGAMWGGVAWIAAVLVIGTRQHALAVLGHDGTHRLAMRGRRSNDAVTRLLCFWPLGTSLTAYRDYHFRHHRHQGTAHDPERSLCERASFRASRRRPSLVRCALLDLLGLGVPDLLHVARDLRGGTPTERRALLAFWTITIAGLWVAQALWILVVWFVALALVFQACFRVRVLSEHPVSAERRFRAGAIARFLFFPHGTWCHEEHHAHPAIACRRLPRLRRDGEAEALPTSWQLFASSPGAAEEIAQSR